MRNGNGGPKAGSGGPLKFPKDMEEEIPLPDGVDIRQPCQYCPGHWVKVEVMRRRYAAGLPLHHEGDVKQMDANYHEGRAPAIAAVVEDEPVDDWGD